jgi:long-chain acyl-CoA synthetase
MSIDFLKEVFADNCGKDAIIWKDSAYSYGWLLERLNFWEEEIDKKGVRRGAVVILDADFSPNAVALFLALAKHQCIVVPLTSSAPTKREEFIEIAQGQVYFGVDENDGVEVRDLPYLAGHEYYDRLRDIGHPGLVLFSSGSTGKSKAAVHDLTSLLEKFKVPRQSIRTITFLLFDHIGGVNTMFYTLFNAGCIITVEARSPDTVLRAVEKHQAGLLPASPTFLNMVLLSEAYQRHDLRSLKLVTYGTEPMPESTLKRFHELFPDIRLLQTYGLSEVGILRSKSRSPDSLWVKIGGEGYETRVVDGVLHVKAQSSVLGYLNAPSPFSDDGWLNTGDAVEVDGEYVKILGRQSEIINVGGEKVYPAEVESVIQEIDNVAEVTVYGEKNPITGQIVCTRVTLIQEQDHKAFVAELKRHCRSKLEGFKVPVKATIVKEQQHSGRFKKIRRLENFSG